MQNPHLPLYFRQLPALFTLKLVPRLQAYTVLLICSRAYFVGDLYVVWSNSGDNFYPKPLGKGKGLGTGSALGSNAISDGIIIVTHNISGGALQTTW